MKRRDRKHSEKRTTRVRPPQVPVATQLPKHRRALQNPKTLAARLQRLAEAIQAAPEQPASAALSHAECEALLEFYVDSESRGDDAHKLYPTVWEHLHSCERCNYSYTLLSESMADNSLLDSGMQEQSSKEQPFLFSSVPDEQYPWVKQIRSRLGGGPLAFNLIIPSRHLQKFFVPTALPMTRGAEALSSRNSLLLSDTFSLGDQKIDVEVWAYQAGDAPQARVEVTIVSSSPLPEPVHVILKWNSHSVSGQIREHRAFFEGIPTTELAAAQDLHIEFKAGTESSDQ